MTQEVEVMVKLTLEADCTRTKADITNDVLRQLEDIEYLSYYSIVNNKVMYVKEEGELYGTV